MAQYTSQVAAFSNTFEEAMANQAATKRQAMMDKLAAKREDRLAQAELDSMQEKRDALAEHKADREEKAHERKISDFEKRTQMMKPGDIPDKEMLDQANELKLAGQFFPKPAASALGMGVTSAEAGPTIEQDPMARPYIGNRADREIADKKKAQEDYAKSLPEGPLKQEAMFALQMGRNPT